MEIWAGPFLLLMFVLLAVAIWLHVAKYGRIDSAKIEQLRNEAEEKYRPYSEAWAKARASDNIEIIVSCGDNLVKAARLWQPQVLYPVAWDVYQEILRRLKTHPDLKPIALEMGRAAYSARRGDGGLTIYDEQAIQNDILVHGE